METCTICVEPYNKRARLRLQCPYCEFVACRTCCQTYLLSETTPKCMNRECAKEWTLHFLRGAFTHSFLNGELKTHREEILFQQEIALLPATQPIVERELRREDLREQIRQLNLQIGNMNREVGDLWTQYYALQYGDRDTDPAQRAEFVRNCPAEDCRGFLSQQWKCGICSKWTCPTCHEVKGYDREAQHTCVAENVATAELISRDTRHCPKCAIPIFKIDGCDQMWCTQCQTGFSWRTGRIETNVHNPHYFEWLRRTGGQDRPVADDAPCGQELTHRVATVIERLLSAKVLPETEEAPSAPTTQTGAKPSARQRSIEMFAHPNAREAFYFLSTIIRATIHLNLVERGRYRTNMLLNNQDLRIQYMRNRLTPEKFKTLVQQRNKKHHKNREILLILDMVVNTVTDIIYRFREYLQSSPSTECNVEMLEEIEKIREYANECLGDISYTYGSVLLRFTETLRLVSS